jgi:hypothetical protein
MVTRTAAAGVGGRDARSAYLSDATSVALRLTLRQLVSSSPLLQLLAPLPAAVVRREVERVIRRREVARQERARRRVRIALAATALGAVVGIAGAIRRGPDAA